MADIATVKKNHGKKSVKNSHGEGATATATATATAMTKKTKVALAPPAPPAPAAPAPPAPNRDYLIQARWTKASFLRQVVESIKDLINETNMDWDKSGIRIQGMDSAHIALSNIFLDATDCECYHVKEGITIGLDMLRMSKILAMANPDDSCELFIKSDEDASLSILLESPNSFKKGLFEIPLLEIEMEFLNIPETIYKNEIKISASEIPSAIREMSFLGDVVTITVDNNRFSISIQGDHGKGVRTWSGDCLTIRSDLDEKFSQPFPIKYLLLALKAATTTQTLILEISDNCPLRIRCMFGKNSHIINFVAPKLIDTDE